MLPPTTTSVPSVDIASRLPLCPYRCALRPASPSIVQSPRSRVVDITPLPPTPSTSPHPGDHWRPLNPFLPWYRPLNSPINHLHPADQVFLSPSFYMASPSSYRLTAIVGVADVTPDPYRRCRASRHHPSCRLRWLDVAAALVRPVDFGANWQPRPRSIVADSDARPSRPSCTRDQRHTRGSPADHFHQPTGSSAWPNREEQVSNIIILCVGVGSELLKIY